MSDNSDLLGTSDGAARQADSLAEASKPKRGRPRKVTPAVVLASTETNTVTFTEPTEQLAPDAPPTAGEAAALLDILAPAAPAPDDPVAVDDALAEKQTAELVSTPEGDGSVSVTLPPVSTEYAAAMASRVQIVGQPKREYAWQRLKRQGKRL